MLENLDELQQLQLPDEILDALYIYQDLLIKWNRRYNLTAVIEPDQIIRRHFIDSLYAREFVRGQRCLDVGSGAGFPGMALALVNQHQCWTLLDSNSKKTRFLQHVKAKLGLQNVEVCHSRVETLSGESVYDTIICRAFAPLNRQLEQLGHLLTSHNQLLAMKGEQVEQEISTLMSSDLLIEPQQVQASFQGNSAILVRITRKS